VRVIATALSGPVGIPLREESGVELMSQECGLADPLTDPPAERTWYSPEPTELNGIAARATAVVHLETIDGLPFTKPDDSGRPVAILVHWQPAGYTPGSYTAYVAVDLSAA
jgi:hypothetical protein